MSLFIYGLRGAVLLCRWIPSSARRNAAVNSTAPSCRAPAPGGAVGEGDGAGWCRQGEGWGPAGPSMAGASDAASALGSPFALNAFTIHQIVRENK